MAICACILTMSCNNNDNEPAASISAAEETITFSGEKGSRSVNVTASGNWTASCEAAWCKAVKAGTSVIISVDRNDGDDIRQALVSLVCGQAAAFVSVEQGVAESQVSVSEKEIILDASATRASFSVSADTPWEISVPQDTDWLSVSPANGDSDADIEVTLAANENTSARQSTLTLSYTDKASGKKKDITVDIMQRAARANISLSQSILEIPHHQSQQTVTLSATGRWSAKITEGNDWIEITPSEGTSGEHTITVTAAENTNHSLRAAAVRFSGEENKFATLRIIQDSMPLIRDTVRFMSYNQHYGFGLDNRIDYARFAEVITNCNPEFVAVQELDSITTRSHRVYQLSRLAELTGMIGTYCPTIDYQGGKYGIGILSRQKPISVRSIPLPVSGEARRIVVAEFENYVFGCTHFPLETSERLTAARVVTEFIEALGTEKPVVIGGDFNALPSESSMARMRQNFMMLNEASERTFPADEPTITIDYLYMYKNAAAGKVIGCGVIDEKVASDHRPVWAEVVFTR